MGRIKQLGETETGQNLAAGEWEEVWPGTGHAGYHRPSPRPEELCYPVSQGFSNRARLTSGQEIRVEGLARSFKK